MVATCGKILFAKTVDRRDGDDFDEDEDPDRDQYSSVSGSMLLPVYYV